MIKKSVAATLAAVIIVGSAATIPAQAAPSKDLRIIPVIVNGKKVKFPDTEPYINTDGFTMVPIRFVSEKLGAEVKWNNATQTATIAYNGQEIAMTIGSKKAVVDGEAIILDTTAEKFEGRTMVPLRFVSEVLHSDVKWDAGAHSVRVTDAAYQQKVASGQVALDPWGREYSKNWDANWMKLTDLEGIKFYSLSGAKPSRAFIDGAKQYNYKSLADVWGSKIRNWYEAQLNVDYRTIDEAIFIKAFMDNADGSITMNSYPKAQMTRLLKKYVAWVKENKVIAKGYADPELSSVYRAGDLNWVPTHFKFMIVSANDTAQVFMDNWDVSEMSDSFKLRKGVWYDGYSVVSMSTNVGSGNAKYGTSNGLRHGENMFMKGNYWYDINE